MPEMVAPRAACSQSSRFPTAGQRERGSGNEIGYSLGTSKTAKAPAMFWLPLNFSRGREFGSKSCFGGEGLRVLDI